MKYEVRVKTGVRGAEAVERIGSASLVVRTHARAHDGEANREVLRLIAEYLGVAKSQIRIESGLKSKNKRVVVPD